MTGKNNEKTKEDLQTKEEPQLQTEKKEDLQSKPHLMDLLLCISCMRHIPVDSIWCPYCGILQGR